MILLFSGGYDSTVLAIQHLDTIDILLHIGYNHPAKEQEQTASLRIYQHLKRRKPSLRYKKIYIPIEAKAMDIGPGQTGSRYVPNRNAIFLSVASNYAHSVECKAIMYGAASLDQKDYPDCRPQFIKQISELLNIQIIAPLLTESYTIQDEILDRSWSCYQPIDGKPCGLCNSCLQDRS